MIHPNYQWYQKISFRSIYYIKKFDRIKKTRTTESSINEKSAPAIARSSNFVRTNVWEPLLECMYAPRRPAFARLWLFGTGCTGTNALHALSGTESTENYCRCMACRFVVVARAYCNMPSVAGRMIDGDNGRKSMSDGHFLWIMKLAIDYGFF